MLNYSRNNKQKISSIIDTFAKIYISEKAYMQMSYIIKNSDIEVGWLATVDRQDNDFYIEECFLIDQEAHCVTCELKEDALNNFALELIENNDIQTYEKLKCWCHSHVNMGVTPSGQDDNQMNLFNDNEYFIRGIGNKKGEMKFDIFDFKNNLLIEDVGWEIERDAEIINRIEFLKEELERLTTIHDESLEANIKLEIKNKVKRIPLVEKGKKIHSNIKYGYGSKYSNYNSYDSYNGYGGYDDYYNRTHSNLLNNEAIYYDDSSAATSIYDYFEYDEIQEKYESLNYNYDKIFNWLKTTLDNATDSQITSYITELNRLI